MSRAEPVTHTGQARKRLEMMPLPVGYRRDWFMEQLDAIEAEAAEQRDTEAFMAHTCDVDEWLRSPEAERRLVNGKHERNDCGFRDQHTADVCGICRMKAHTILAALRGDKEDT